MPMLTAVLVVTVCTTIPADPCGTYKLADFYGAFEQAGRNHCDALALVMNSAPAPKGSNMAYHCATPSRARQLVDSDLDTVI